MRTNKQIVPTTTAIQSRVVVYQPTQRPRLMTGEWHKTAWGVCKVDGRLGQRHADLVEALFFTAEKKRTVDDGGMELLVDPAQVRKCLSDSRYSFTQIEKLLVELRAATITIEMPALDFPIVGGLIDHVVPSKITRPDPLTGKERHMWRVRVGVALRILLDHDLHLYYDPTPIARLTHGISQAVVRHILSHKNEPKGGWHIDAILQTVSGKTGTGQWIRNDRRRLKSDAESMAKIGVIVDGDRIRIAH